MSAAPMASAMTPGVSFRTSVLPWSISIDDERRFKRITNAVLLGAAIVFIAMPWLPVTQPDRSQPQELPPVLARLMIEAAKPPPPPAPMAKLAPEKPVSRPEVALPNRPEPIKAQPRRPEPKKIEAVSGAPVPEARAPVEGKPPGEVDLARRKAAGIGLLAMKDDLAQMHGAPLAVQLRADIKQGPGVGSGTGVGVGAGDEVGLPARALITSNATNGSGGINTASYSRNTGGGGLAGRSTTMVAGVAGGGGGGGYGGGGVRGRDGNGTGNCIGGNAGVRVTVPADACGVCTSLPSAAKRPFRTDDLRAALAGAPAALAEARQNRARLLFELWVGTSLAADQWVLAEMQGALRRVEETVKEAMPVG